MVGYRGRSDLNLFLPKEPGAHPPFESIEHRSEMFHALVNLVLSMIGFTVAVRNAQHRAVGRGKSWWYTAGHYSGRFAGSGTDYYVSTILDRLRAERLGVA